MKKWFYNLMYGYDFVPIPYDIGPRVELVDLVESGRLKPGRAIDLGSGTASNVIFLAQHGYDVTGVDFSPAAIQLGRQRAEEAGVDVTFIQDDLTDLQHVDGPFDLLVDYGTLDDLHPDERDRYVENVLPLSRSGSQFVLYVFEWKHRWWDRLLTRLAGAMAVEPGEVEARFGRTFAIEEIARYTTDSRIMPGMAVYFLTRE